MNKQQRDAIATKAETYLRAKIELCGKSHNQLARETSVAQPVISRFVRGDRSLSYGSAAVLLFHFGVDLTGRRR